MKVSFHDSDYFDFDLLVANFHHYTARYSGFSLMFDIRLSKSFDVHIRLTSAFDYITIHTNQNTFFS